MGPLIIVEDIASSRRFYEHLLGQKVKYDFGVNVTFAGDFSIHLQAHFQTLLGEGTPHPVTRKTHNAELTFETDEIEALCQRLEQAGVAFAHPIQESRGGSA